MWRVDGASAAERNVRQCEVSVELPGPGRRNAEGWSVICLRVGPADGRPAIESETTHQRARSETLGYGTHENRSDMCRPVA